MFVQRKEIREVCHPLLRCLLDDGPLCWFVFVSSLLALSLMCFTQKHPGASAASGAALIKGWRSSLSRSYDYFSFLSSYACSFASSYSLRHALRFRSPNSHFTLFPLPLFTDQSFLREIVAFERKNKCGGAKHILREVINRTAKDLFKLGVITIRTIIMF